MDLIKQFRSKTYKTATRNYPVTVKKLQHAMNRDQHKCNSDINNNNDNDSLLQINNNKQSIPTICPWTEKISLISSSVGKQSAAAVP